MGAIQQLVAGRVDLNAPVRAGQPLAKPRIRFGRRDEPAEGAGRQRREVRPDVVVAEPEDPDPQGGQASTS